MDEIKKAIEAQNEYCKEHHLLRFAPPDGFCYSCYENIYRMIERTGWRGRQYISGISLEEAGSSLITYCPHCHRSFCE